MQFQEKSFANSKRMMCRPFPILCSRSSYKSFNSHCHQLWLVRRSKNALSVYLAHTFDNPCFDSGRRLAFLLYVAKVDWRNCIDVTFICANDQLHICQRALIPQGSTPKNATAVWLIASTHLQWFPQLYHNVSHALVAPSCQKNTIYLKFFPPARVSQAWCTPDICCWKRQIVAGPHHQSL